MPSQLPERPTLSDFQADIKRLVIEKGWDDETIQDVFLLMVEEVGELAKEIRKVTGMHLDVAKAAPATQAELEGEVADIFNYLLDLANKLGVDLEQAYRRKQIEIDGRLWQ